MYCERLKEHLIQRLKSTIHNLTLPQIRTPTSPKRTPNYDTVVLATPITATFSSYNTPRLA
jgi:hypothetical protein